MSEPFRIGIAGLGTVGAGVVKIIQENADLLAARCGRSIEIMAVSARDRTKDRGVDLSSYEWVDDPVSLASCEELGAVVELIGGSDGPALNLVRGALTRGASVITANKALVAHHGVELAELAETQGASLAYEAAVAGGVPVIKVLREGLTANKITALYGILNGTANYILTAMREDGRDFGDALKEAQEKGYAESDPTFDIEGIDAGHKLAILAAIAFGMRPDFRSVKTSGISHLTIEDINSASELGYKIKLLGIAKDYDGKILQSVEPCLVPASSPLGAIEGVYNAIFIEGNFVETPLLSGLGAGQGATASSVVADIVDLARGLKIPTFGVPALKLLTHGLVDQNKLCGRYYMRMGVLDKPGVIADISAVLRDHEVSIESLLQKGHDPEQPVSIVMTTHNVNHGNLMKASKLIAGLDISTAEPCILRIEDEL